MAYRNEKTTIVFTFGLGNILLFMLFAGLKLGKIISWSWWWITAPLWIPWILFLAIALVLFVVYLVIKFIRTFRYKSLFGKRGK